MQPQSIPLRGRVVMVAAALLCGMLAPARAQHSGTPNDGVTWTLSPAHVALFAPPSLREHYSAFVTTQPLDGVVTRVAAAAQPLPPGAWVPESLGPVDAFGESGPYNRWTVARLYRGTPLRVARGPREVAGRLETWTLISPYPDASVTRLEPGTLLLVTRVPPL